MIKAARNVINPEAAEKMAEELIAERLRHLEDEFAERVAGWLRAAGRKHWIREGPASVAKESEVRRLSWAKSKDSIGLALKLELGEEQKRQAEEIIDWMISEKPRQLEKVSFEQALEASKQWHERIAAKEREAAEQERPEELAEVVAMGEERWVRLEGERQLNREGRLMRHCVGSYAKRVGDGNTRIYSLRDAKNKPKLTVELVRQAQGWSISQVRGFANTSAQAQEGPALKALLERLAEDKELGALKGGEELDNSGLIFDEATQKLTLISELPKGSVIKKWMTFNKKLPENVEDLVFEDGVVINDWDASKRGGSLSLRLGKIAKAQVSLRKGAGEDFKLSAIGGQSVRVILDGEWRSVEVQAPDALAIIHASPRLKRKVDGVSPEQLNLWGLMDDQSDSVETLKVKAKKARIEEQKVGRLEAKLEEGMKIERCDVGSLSVQGDLSVEVSRVEGEWRHQKRKLGWKVHDDVEESDFEHQLGEAARKELMRKAREGAGPEERRLERIGELVARINGLAVLRLPERMGAGLLKGGGAVVAMERIQKLSKQNLMVSAKDQMDRALSTGWLRGVWNGWKTEEAKPISLGPEREWRWSEPARVSALEWVRAMERDFPEAVEELRKDELGQGMVDLLVDQDGRLSRALSMCDKALIEMDSEEVERRAGESEETIRKRKPREIEIGAGKSAVNIETLMSWKDPKEKSFPKLCEKLAPFGGGWAGMDRAEHGSRGSGLRSALALLRWDQEELAKIEWVMEAQDPPDLEPARKAAACVWAAALAAAQSARELGANEERAGRWGRALAGGLMRLLGQEPMEQELEAADQVAREARKNQELRAWESCVEGLGGSESVEADRQRVIQSFRDMEKELRHQKEVGQIGAWLAKELIEEGGLELSEAEREDLGDLAKEASNEMSLDQPWRSIKELRKAAKAIDGGQAMGELSRVEAGPAQWAPMEMFMGLASAADKEGLWRAIKALEDEYGRMSWTMGKQMGVGLRKKAARLPAGVFFMEMAHQNPSLWEGVSPEQESKVRQEAAWWLSSLEQDRVVWKPERIGMPQEELARRLREGALRGESLEQVCAWGWRGVLLSQRLIEEVSKNTNPSARVILWESNKEGSDPEATQRWWESQARKEKEMAAGRKAAP